MSLIYFILHWVPGADMSTTIGGDVLQRSRLDQCNSQIDYQLESISAFHSQTPMQNQQPTRQVSTTSFLFHAIIILSFHHLSSMDLRPYLFCCTRKYPHASYIPRTSSESRAFSTGAIAWRVHECTFPHKQQHAGEWERSRVKRAGHVSSQHGQQQCIQQSGDAVQPGHARPQHHYSRQPLLHIQPSFCSAASSAASFFAAVAWQFSHSHQWAAPPGCFRRYEALSVVL